MALNLREGNWAIHVTDSYPALSAIHRSLLLKRISILLIALLALVVAACGSGQASPSASATESATAAATEEPTTEASESVAPSEQALPSGSAAAIPSFDLNADPELAARFPDTVAGQPLEVQTVGGDMLAMTGGLDPSFQAVLDSLGASIEDVSLAVGATEAADFTVGAFRIKGAAEDDLERAFLDATEDAGDIAGIEEASIGGKDVWTAQNPADESGGTAYIYVKDDTVYFVTGTEEQAAEILAALP